MLINFINKKVKTLKYVEKKFMMVSNIGSICKTLCLKNEL